MNANKWTEPLPRVFYILPYFETILPSEESDLPQKMRYILWMLALEACDVSNDGRHLGRHLTFYQVLEIRSKPRGMELFCT